MRRVLVLATSIAALVACSQPSADPTDGGPQSSVQARLSEPFDLRVGQIATVDGLSIAFRRVGGDSRCPRGVTCVWSGDAVVALEVAVARMAWNPLELHTHVEPRAASFRQHAIELVELSPYPVEGQTIRPASYVAKLKVTRR